jgi:hypothetical protein
MAVHRAATAARRPRAAFILGAALLVFGVFSGHALMAQTSPAAPAPAAPSAPAPVTAPGTVPATTPATAAPAAQLPPQVPAATAGPGTPKAGTSQGLVRPLWSELTPLQQQALAPLAGEWDQLDTFRKGKWLAIGNRYHSMKPDEQNRVQERMREWIKLTPEQRKMARESFARAKKLDSTQKNEHWQQYQQLPEEQKKKLAEDATAKKKVATLPSAASQAKNEKPVPPIKSAPKPVIEQSVTPKAATQAPLQNQDAAPANK